MSLNRALIEALLRLYQASLPHIAQRGAERERQGKARHLLYLHSEIDVAPRRYQLLHRARVQVTRCGVDRRPSTLGERVRGVVWCGGGGERVWWTYIDIQTHMMQVRYFPGIYC